MRKVNKYFIIALLLLKASLFTACSQKDSNLAETLKSYEVQSIELNNRIENLNIRVNNLETQNSLLLGMISEQVAIMSDDYDESNSIILPVYHVDAFTDEKRIQYYMLLYKDSSLEDKIRIVSEKLRSSFYGLSIELVKIDNEAGKKVAIIDLRYSENSLRSGGRTWAGNAFQGTTGGWITSYKLIKTFLQEEYTGEWIDGVRFTYNGESTNRFEHIGDLLEKTYFRGE